MNIVLIDGDLIVYEAAYCVEAKEKEGVYLNWYQVSKIVNTIVRSVLLGTKATHHLGFLTHGKSNFRLKVATTLPYKGQRKTNNEKPKFYDEIRHYLETHFGFQMMKGIEADDALTIASEHFKGNPKVKTIIATKDKDLWQYAGLHYNMNKNKRGMMEITEAEAHRYLWKQMILGDMPTDNIPGLSHAAKHGIAFPSEEAKKKFRPLREHQYGEVTAKEILDKVDPEDYASHIYQLYVDEYWDEEEPDFGDYRFHETWQLIYMLRELPEGVTMHFNPIKVKFADVEFDDDFDNRPALEF